MDLDSQTRNLLITLGTLSGVGIIIALIRTCAWSSKAGREAIDSPVSIFSLQR
jgi:hypothetical protein